MATHFECLYIIKQIVLFGGFFVNPIQNARLVKVVQSCNSDKLSFRFSLET